LPLVQELGKQPAGLVHSTSCRVADSLAREKHQITDSPAESTSYTALGEGRGRRREMNAGSVCERRKIVGLAQQAGGQGVLVTLVRAEGSSYRRTGARLLAAGSALAGTISGGCLETEVVRRAPWIVREGAAVERYSMQFDDTTEVPFGLGCGGVLHLLFEPLGTAEADALLEALTSSLAGHVRTVVHFLPGSGRGLRRLVLDEGSEVLFRSAALTDEKIACARELHPGQDYDGRFVERLEPPQRLFLFGAGDDACPLVDFAAALGWRITVADGRANMAQARRFPRAERVEVVEDEGSLEGFGIGLADAVVLMTHSFVQDRHLLTQTLPREPRYLGLLGARHRSSLLVHEAALHLGLDVATCCERVHAPVGLDLGGDGPEAIALAIVAEIQAVVNGRFGSQRRLNADEVSEQILRGGSEDYLRTQCALGAAS
jgi:xanthine dehydrogenase accessory factor